jgi:hypothetical protein
MRYIYIIYIYIYIYIYIIILNFIFYKNNIKLNITERETTMTCVHVNEMFATPCIHNRE